MDIGVNIIDTCVNICTVCNFCTRILYDTCHKV